MPIVPADYPTTRGADVTLRAVVEFDADGEARTIGQLAAEQRKVQAQWDAEEDEDAD